MSIDVAAPIDGARAGRTGEGRQVRLAELRVVFWGTYDVGKPRVRLLIAAARAVGMSVVECHRNVWKDVEDKSQLRGAGRIVWLLLRWMAAYPILVWNYVRLPPHDVVVVSYPGQLDILILGLLARIRGVPLVWDAFLSLYDTVVDDRQLVSRRSAVAGLLYAADWMACRSATKIFLDTQAHARYFENTFNLAAGSVGTVILGAEPQFFSEAFTTPSDSSRSLPTILFYGQFIPLHGIETIVRAASVFEARGQRARWLLVGTGQEDRRIAELIEALEVRCIERVSWVPYEQLARWILGSEICLGIFGTSGKASRVIPNKVFQILAVRRPLITADTPAVRELLHEGPMVRLVPPGDPEALASAAIDLLRSRTQPSSQRSNGHVDLAIGPDEVGRQLADLLLGLQQA